MTERVLLLAGSVGPERVPSRRDPEQTDWYLPLHVRDAQAARERLAGQVTVGADAVVAPTWLTHRRALLPLGETRRAGAWTAAAVRTAREAVEIGLERRQEALAGVPGDDVRRGRPATLVAASLPALDDAPESEGGRLMPREAATARDYRDQAGAIADAEPDIILVEGQADDAGARNAITEASDTGLPVWAALTSQALAASDLEAWLEWAQMLNVERLLLPGPLDDRAAAAEGGVAFGALAPSREPLETWLDAGASAVARLDGASNGSLEPLRTAIDDYERAGIEAATIARARWERHVADAAALADGGAAAWIGRPAAAPLPPGFEWLLVDPDGAYQLPDHRYRLVVLAAGVRLDPARLLQPGGIAAVADTDVVARSPELRLLAVEDSSLPVLAIARRER